MPTYGPLTDDLIDAFDDYEHDRRACMVRAYDCYSGRHPDSLAITDPRDPDDNLALNYGAWIVDSSVQALYGQECDWQFNGDEGSEPEAAFEAWRQANTFLLLLQKLATNGARSGTAYAKLSQRADGSVHVRALDSRIVTAFWEPEDTDDVWAYLLRWTMIAKDGKRMARRQIVERVDEGVWDVRDEMSRENEKRWTSLGTVRWPYEWCPIHACQNLPDPDEFYGQPDLPDDLIDLIYQHNRAASNANKIIRLHAHPKLIGFGLSTEQLQMGPDDMPLISNPDARVDMLVPNVQGIAASLDFMARLREGMNARSRTPEVAAGKLESAGDLSGVALQILYGPAIAKTEQKRLTYGPMVEHLALHVVELLRSPAETCETTWPSIVPGDPLTERQVAQADVDLGVSKATVLESLGYDAQKELDASREESEASIEQQQLAFGSGNFANRGPALPEG